MRRIALALACTLACAAAHAGPAPAVADVGDVDSFGRPVKWLAVTDTSVTLADDCSDPDPDGRCQLLSPAGAPTSFAFEDLARVVLPPKAANSLLCHWLSPSITVSWSNPGATPVIGRLDYNPTLTVENPVLATPGLVDATTGLPFGGRLRTTMTASERLGVPLPAGASFDERQRDSAVCIAGFLTRKSLVQQYGLSEAQAAEFFKQPTTVRLNVSGNARHAGFVQLYFGLRIVGD